MLFWIIAAVMTAVVTIAALWPLFAPAADGAPTRADHDVEVYAAQLRELDADLERGTIGQGEAETARAEIGRRLLKAAEAARSGGKGTTNWGRPAILAAIAGVAVLVPIVSAGLYTGVGAGGLADEPLASRRMAKATGSPTTIGAGGGSNTQSAAASVAENDGADIMTLVADAEQRLKENPQDGRGWDVLAPIYLRMDRNGDAVDAFRKAIEILGPTATREGGLGEALTQAAGGEVTDEAKAAFERSIAINAQYLPSRFFLALDLSQEQKSAAAEKAWSQLIEMSPENAPWLRIANAALADAKQKLNGGPAVAAAEPPSSEPGTATQERGPNEADVAAATEMEAGDRQAMIQGMVAQLAARLETNPDDVEGWKRLIRSYTVLGEEEKASDAYRTAKRTFEANSAAGREIAAFGTEIGLSAGEETTSQ